MPEFLSSGYHNCDCLAEMRKYPDKYFDLAIVDPPYGGGNNEDWDTKKRGRFSGMFGKYQIKNNNTELGTHFHGRGRSAKYKIDNKITANRNGGNLNKNYENK